ncbi:MAG: hypothetical protein ACKOFH_09460, partial [Chthoniobacterales bacterium]
MPELYWWAIAILLAGGVVGYLIGRLKSVAALSELAAARSRADEVGRQLEMIEGERRSLLARVQEFTAELATEKQKTTGLE